MQKSLLLIVLLLCAPNTHTAAALEDLPASKQIDTALLYVDKERAQEINRTIQHCLSHYRSRFGTFFRHTEIFDRAHHADTLAQKKKSLANAFESISISNEDKLNILLSCLNGDVFSHYWADCKKLIIHMTNYGFTINDFKPTTKITLTPLIASIKQADLQFTSYLLEQNADVNAQENSAAQNTALDCIVDAINSTHPTHVSNKNRNLELLIAYDANPDVPSPQNELPAKEQILNYNNISLY